MPRACALIGIILLSIFLTPPSAHALDPLWSRSFGDEWAQVLSAVDVSPAGVIVAAGNFMGILDLGGGPLSSAGEYDIFLAAYSPNGHHLWSRSFGDISNDKVRDVVVDFDGNIVLVGDFFQTLDFGGGALISAGGKDAFVAKFDSNGTHLWSANFGDSDYQSAECVTVSFENQVILAGQFRGDIDLGGGSISSLDAQDIFLAGLDAEGSHIWSRSLAGYGDQWARDLHLEMGEDLCLAGSFEGTLDSGSDIHFSIGDRDAFLALYSPADGLPVWSRAYGALGNQDARAVSSGDPWGLVLAGDFEDSIDLGDGIMHSQGLTDIFLAYIYFHGVCDWSRQFGDSASQFAEDVVVDPGAGIGMTGYVEGVVDFGGGPLSSSGGMDIFLATFRRSGSTLGSALYGDSSEQRGVSLAVDPSQHFLLGSWFFGSVDFGLGNHTSAGNADFALVRYEADPTAAPESAPRLDLNAWPNPFNPSTEILFRLAESTPIELSIHDVSGQGLRILLSATNLESGVHRIEWDGRNDRGEALPSGIYLCKLRAGSLLKSQKLVLLK